MVFERMTDRAREALGSAHRAARDCNHDAVDAPHLLLGILRQNGHEGLRGAAPCGPEYLDVLVDVEEM